MYVCACIFQRILDTTIQIALTFFETAAFTGQEHAKKARLADQKDTGICLIFTTPDLGKQVHAIMPGSFT